jgi:hypothetical protein
MRGVHAAQTVRVATARAIIMGRSGNNRGRRRGRSRRTNGVPVADRGGRPCEGGSTAHPELCALSPFSVFCALYLGITERNGFAAPQRAEVERRFDMEPSELEAYLEEQQLRTDDLKRADFDLESARLDIRVAPEGISRAELARTMFEELRDALSEGTWREGT